MKINKDLFCISLAFSYLTKRSSYFSLDNKNKKNTFLFCIVLAFLYLRDKNLNKAQNEVL